MQANARAKVWSVLGLTSAEVASLTIPDGVVMTVAGLRLFFSEYELRTDVAFMRALLQGCAACMHCHGSDTSLGFVQLRRDRLAAHVLGKKHANKVAAAARTSKALTASASKTQTSLLDAGLVLDKVAMEREKAATLLVAHFIACGIPPSTVPRLLPQDVLVLISQLAAGMPSVSTITKVVVPAAVTLVEEEIENKFKGKSVSIAIDGGAAYNLLDKGKIVVVTASAPGLKTAVLEIVVLDGHETAEVQKNIIVQLALRYKIDKDKFVYLVADNASVNKKTVKLLNEAGFKIVYVRCLPHCLNLVMVAFLDNFNSTFGLVPFLKQLRGFINAGGSASRRALVLEYGLSSSRVDVADPRWSSVVEALLYLTSEQSDFHLSKARKALQRKADAGDQSAKDALEEPDEKLNVWHAMTDMIEAVIVEPSRKSVAEIGSVDADLGVTQKALLEYLASLKNFAAFWALRFILGRSDVDAPGGEHDSVSTVFALTQGGQDWEAKLESRATGVVPTAVGAVEALLTSFEYIATDDGVDALKSRLEEKLEEQIEFVLATHKKNGDALTIKSKAYDAADVPAFRAAMEKVASKAVVSVIKTLGESSSKMKACKGLAKLKEAVAALVIVERFSLAKKSAELPASDADVLAFLGVPESMRHFNFVPLVRVAWAAHRAAWTEDVHGAMSPAETHTYYSALLAPTAAPASKLLGKLAMYHLLRPTSATTCERVFRFLTDMDTPSRSTMERELLVGSLKLRGNAETVNELVAAAAHSFRMAASINRDEVRKRRHEEAVAASSFDVAAATLQVKKARTGEEVE